MALSVKSDTFDDTMGMLQKIGDIRSVVIAKKDMTDSFRSLHAKKGALLKYQEALSKLRTSEGKVEEFIKLEEKILVLQEDIRTLSIQLGDFAQEESYCNVAMALAEREGAVQYSLKDRIGDVILWSIGKYFYLVCAIFVVYLVYVSVRLVRQ